MQTGIHSLANGDCMGGGGERTWQGGIQKAE